MSKATTNRLSALDGLRGFAILLVFLNHITVGYVQNLLPASLFSWIFINGVTGVTFLFILSGFLMSSIYPNPPSTSAFLQKRYTRIFPLFLTMSAIMFTGRLTPHATPLFFLAVLICYALFTYSIWVYGVKKLPKVFGRVLFFSFLFLQVCAGLFYVFWVAKQPPIVFNHLLPTFMREGTIYLVNATLTLPLGQYVPMLDGVYWTLVAEVLFYVLYPTIILPLANMLVGKATKVKVLFLLCLIPLLGGIHMLSYKIFVLSLVQPALFFYFATGIFLGFLYKNHTQLFENFSKKLFPGPLAIMPLLLFFITVATVNDLSFLGQVISPWIRMLYAIPLTFLVAILLDRKTLLSKFFSLRALTFIGTISYSIYLSHSLVIHVATLIFTPTSIMSDIAYILIVFGINVIVASFLFFFLERPYFAHDIGPKLLATKAKKAAITTKRLSAKYIVIGICTIYLFGVFAGYQSQNGLNFFSYTSPIPQKDFVQSKVSNFISPKSSTPITLRIFATSDNFGLLLLRIEHTPKPQKIPQALQFSLYEKGSSAPLTQATYSLDQFDKDFVFPFGFPNIINAKGKTYIAEFVLTNPQSQDTITIDTHSGQAVYAADKKELLKNPIKLLSFTENKLQNVFLTGEALFVLLLLIPFAVISFFLLRRKRYS